MKNTGGRYGGAITAAQFLQRFVKDTPWAHLDIAGTGMAAEASDVNKSWGSGFRRAPAGPPRGGALRGLKRSRIFSIPQSDGAIPGAIIDERAGIAVCLLCENC